MEDPSNNY